MNVTRIKTPTGSHIEPPLDQDWDDHTKLTWHAAVISHDTGIRIAVHPGMYTVDDQPKPGYYNLVVGSSSSGPHTFHSAWAYLNGVCAGARSTTA